MAICSGKVYWVECDRCYNAVAHQEMTPEKAERLARTAGYIEIGAEWLCRKCAAITQKKLECEKKELREKPIELLDRVTSHA